MKQVFIIMVVLVAGNAKAQIEKGTWLVGANTTMGFNSYTASSGSDATIFNIGGKAGYFVAENFVLGLNLEYLNISQGNSNNSITTLGPFIRYYASKVFFGAGYNSISASGGSTSFGSIPMEAGFVGFITRNIAVEPALVYTISTDPDNGAISGIGAIPFSAKSAFGIKVGFTLFLGRGEE